MLQTQHQLNQLGLRKPLKFLPIHRQDESHTGRLGKRLSSYCRVGRLKQRCEWTKIGGVEVGRIGVENNAERLRVLLETGLVEKEPTKHPVELVTLARNQFEFLAVLVLAPIVDRLEQQEIGGIDRLTGQERSGSGGLELAERDHREAVQCGCGRTQRCFADGAQPVKIGPGLKIGPAPIRRT